LAEDEDSLDVDISRVGKPISEEDFDMIVEAITARHRNFPDEPANLTMAMVFTGIGKRFTPVECAEQEWAGTVQDIPKGDGEPKCPNGHPLTLGKTITIGWVEIPD
jgi:hypothetical protein